MSGAQGPGDVASVRDALAYWATRTPNAVALLSPGREAATYEQVHAAANRLAAHLRTLGLGRRDGIAILFPEGPELCLALLAALSTGIAIPLAWPNPEGEYRRVLSHGTVRAILAADVTASALGSIDPAVPVLRLAPSPSGRVGALRFDDEMRGPAPPETQPESDDIALIIHSSGTTGQPKLTPRTHGNIVSMCRLITETRSLSPADRCLGIARLVYSQGFNSLVSAIYSGGSILVTSGFDVGMLPAWLEAFRPTYTSTSAPVIRDLAADRGAVHAALRRYPLTHIVASAGPLATGDADRLESALGIPIVRNYGMSEASGIAGESFPAFHRVPGSIGIPWCEIRVVGDGDAPLEPGRAGEIVVRGPRVFPGYLDDPAANAAAFLPGGWFRTGDIGFLDGSGYLHLVGRRGEIVNRGGEKIAPREVDDVLRTHPAVADAAVFAVADARLGEDLVAAVVLKPGMEPSARELRAWILDELASYKAPRRIWLVKRLPRTPTGKVQRGELARLWEIGNR